MKEGRKKGNVSEFPSGIQEQMRKKNNFNCRGHVSAVWGEQEYWGMGVWPSYKALLRQDKCQAHLKGQD